MDHCPYLFCLPFYLFYFVLPPFEEMGCLSRCLMSSASIQKLFCEICSAFKCSFNKFVGEKVVSPSYSSAILGPLPYSSVFAWRIPWTEEPSRPSSMGLQKVGYDWAHHIPYGSAVPLLGIYLKKIKTLIWKDTYILILQQHYLQLPRYGNNWNAHQQMNG